MNEHPVSLEPASPSEEPLLANLLELYLHDLSECFQIDVRPDGRFGYERLPLYWSEPQRRFPYLIRSGGRVAGFVFATLGSPASDDPNVFDVAEFFVLRKYRHTGIGRRAAHLLWRQRPGRWFVRVFKRNTGAFRFWRQVVSEYAPGATEEFRGESPNGWYVLSF